MNFVGEFFKRRSSEEPNGGPPGESEVQACNPDHVTLIRGAAAWSRLEPGSLNLKVDNSVVDDLLKYKPVLKEDAANIRYPAPYQDFPKFMRGAYYYYAAVARGRGQVQDVLVRRALFPLPNVVELFAMVNLTAYFRLELEDHVMVGIDESKSPLQTTGSACGGVG